MVKPVTPQLAEYFVVLGTYCVAINGMTVLCGPQVVALINEYFNSGDLHEAALGLQVAT